MNHHSGQSKRSFELEALEPRVLLSADALLVSSLAGNVRQDQIATHEETFTGSGIAQNSGYDAASQVAGIFDGITTESISDTSSADTAQPPVSEPETALESTPAVTVSASATPSAPAVQVIQNSDSAAEAATTVTATSSAVSQSVSTEVMVGPSDASVPSVPENGSSITDQLTETLKSANGPPAAVLASALGIYASSQTTSDQIVTASTTAGSSSSTPALSSSRPSLQGGSGSPADITLTINAELSDIQNGGNGSVVLNLGSVSMGGMLTLNSVTLSFSVTYSEGAFSGSVTISAASANLNLGGAVTSTINNITGTFSLPDRTFELTLGQASFAVSSFVSVTANGAHVFYDPNASTTATITNGVSTTTKSVSVLTIGLDGVSIFAGVNAGTPGAAGIQLTDASLALAIFRANDGTSYYGLRTTAGSLGPVGLPDGIEFSAGDLSVEINAGNDGNNVVDFTGFEEGKWTVQTGSETEEDLEFSEAYLRVAGTLTLNVLDYISIGGSFSFEKTGSKISIDAGHTAFDGAQDITFTLGPSDSPFFSASGYLSMSFDSSSFTIAEAGLTVNGSFSIASVLEIATPSVSISNLTIDRATGDVTGSVDEETGEILDPVITIAAESASFFPGNASFSATITGLSGSFNLRTNAFSISIDEFELAVGTFLSADATDILITYDPTDDDPHQQLVVIGEGNISLDTFNIYGSISNLTIYADGFYFESLTLGYNGQVALGSILTIDNPSLTLTDFGMTFGEGAEVTASGSISVHADNAALNVGSAFSVTAEDLTITVSLDPDTLGALNISAGTLTFQFGTYLTIEGTGIEIATEPGDGEAYLSVETATVTLALSAQTSFIGSASDFALVNAGGSPEFQEGDDFSISITATPGALKLPTWLGFQIQSFSIRWEDFADHPEDFELILSASITSINGLPGGVTVSGFVEDAVIDIGKLIDGEFPITSIGAFGGGVEGNLFGMEVNASFIIGVVRFNAEGGVINADGSVDNPDGTTTLPEGNPDTTVVGSVMYVGISGGASIPGLGGVQIYLGFSQLGPLMLYVKAEFPLIIEPTSGLAIGGFSAGISFYETITPPGSPFELRNAEYGSADDIDVAKWQQQLKTQTIAQYQDIQGGGGEDNSAAYNAPFLIRAGVTIYDAYLSQEAFKIEGEIAIAIDPANPNTITLLLTGTATFGDSVNFKAYMYATLTVDGGSTTAQLTFLFDAPAEIPIYSIGGTLTFGFVDENGDPIVPPAIEVGEDGSFEPPAEVDGFYISFTGIVQYSAGGTLTASVNGTITLTVTSNFSKMNISGTLNISYLGDLATVSGQVVADYSGGIESLKIYGALKLQAGSGLSKLEEFGLYVDDAAITFQLNTTLADQTVYLPDPAEPHNRDLDTPFEISGDTIFGVSLTGIAEGTPASIRYELEGQQLFSMKGSFDLNINTDGLQMFANIEELIVGPEDASFLTLQGYGLFIINDAGIAAAIQLSLQAGQTSAQFSTGFTLEASFALVMNTTSQDIDYDIPDHLPAITIPGSNPAETVRSLTIPRGPPQGLLQSNGQFASTGAAGPYIVITGQGTLGISFAGLDVLSFEGFFRFELSASAAGARFSLIINMTGDVAGFADIGITGALQIDSEGVVALLYMGVTAGATTDYGDGVTLEASFQLGINSTSADVSEIGGIALADEMGNPITLSAETYQVIGTGVLRLSIAGTGFVIRGSIFASVSGTRTELSVSGSLTATVLGVDLLTMTATGVLVVETGGANPGIAGRLELSLSAGNPMSGTGFSFDGSFELQLNTTGVSQSVPVPGGPNVTIAAGPAGSSTGADYIQVKADGTLTFGTTDTGFLLDGDFYLAIGSNGLAISASVLFKIKVGGTQLLSVSASAGLLISSDGFAALLEITTSITDPDGYFYFGGTFKLSVNTTGEDVVINSVTIPGAAEGMAAGPYFQIGVTGAMLKLGSTSSSTSSGLMLSGSFMLTISSQGLAISAEADLLLKVSGTTIFSFEALGALLITGDGIACKIELELSSGGINSEFEFDASFLLEVNTTGQFISTINNVTVNLPGGGGVYFKVSVSGKLRLANLVDISGSFTLTVTATEVNMQINASLNVLGFVFRINAGVGIYSDGIEINAVLTINSGTAASFLSGLITIDAQFVLKINTSSSTSHYGVAPGTAFWLKVHGSSGFGNAKVYIFGFRLEGQLDIYATTGGDFYATGTLSFNFFGFVTFQVDFYFDSKGKYWFYGTTYVQLGSDDFNIHGSLLLMFSNVHAVDTFRNPDVIITPGFRLRVDGGVTAFGYDFASIGAEVQINGTSVDISVYVSVDLGLFEVGGTVHIHIGTLATVPTPPPPAIAQVLPGGILRLNIGVDAGSRGVDALPDENYTITLIGTNGDGSVNLSVYAPGVWGSPLIYNNVNSILVAGTGTSNTTIQIAGNVNKPVTIHAGSGKNQFFMGGGHATIYGSSGKDKVVGGTGGVTLYAGSGGTTFIGGSANNYVHNDGPVVVIVSGYHAYTLSNSALTYDGFTTTLVGELFTITLTAANTGVASFAVNGYSHVLTVDGNGNPNATASVTLDGNLTLTGGSVAGSNGLAMTLVSVQAISLNGGAGANTLTVNSWSGSGAVSLNGNDGSDTLKVNFQGSGSYTVNANGGGGVDTLIVNATDGGDTLAISAASITRASETVNYSAIEDVVVNAFGGTDTFNITNPSAATTINGGNGSNTFNVNSISNALTINTGAGTNVINVPNMDAITAGLEVNGGGTETLNLTDPLLPIANTGVLGANSFTGFFGAGGSLTYSGVETMNIVMGTGPNTLTISGRSGVTSVTSYSGNDTFHILAVSGTTSINAGTGFNIFNVGSNAFNLGLGQIIKVQGTLNLTGSGDDLLNVDDSGSSKPEQATLRPGSLRFFDPLIINFSGMSVLNIALGQGADIFAVVDTFADSSGDVVIELFGNDGDDIISVLDTHAEMTINGGGGNDSMYVFGNSSVLNLNGNDGDDTFYIFASLFENEANINAGTATPVGNTIYSYRQNADVNINGGSGYDRVYIFGTVLNDVIIIDGTNVSGAGLNVNFEEVEELIVAGLGGDDIFYVLHITVKTTLIGDGELVTMPPVPPDVELPDLTGGAEPTSWDDTFYIGYQGQYIPGSLSTIAAVLTIQGSEGEDVAYIDNRADTLNRNFTLTGTTLDSDAFSPGGQIVYDNTVDNLNILSGSGHDNFTINGTGAGLQTTIDAGAGNDDFVVNAPLTTPLALHGEANTFFGDTLTINGTIFGDNFVVTSATVDGAGATISYGTIELLTINGLNGEDTFTVNSDSIPTYLNGGDMNDRFTINANSVSLFLDGGAGNEAFLLSGNSGALSVLGGEGEDWFFLSGNSGSLTASGGVDNDLFYVTGNSGSPVTLNGDAGNDDFLIYALSSPATLQGGADNDRYYIFAPLAASATIIDGAGETDQLSVQGTVGNDFWVIASTVVSGVGAPVYYFGLDYLTLDGVSGNDTFNVRSTLAITEILTGTGINTVNIGSLAPVTGGNVDGLLGALTIIGSGNDTLNIDDTGSTAGKTGVLTINTLTGLGTAGITYYGMAALNLSLGSGDDTLTISTTHEAPTTINGNNGADVFNIQGTYGVSNINGGNGNDTFNVGSLAPATPGHVNNVFGTLNLSGGGDVDSLFVDETGDTEANTGLLTSTTLTGLGLGGGINYSGLENLTINLGSGSDTFNVQSTLTGTAVSLNTGAGANVINVGSLAPATGGILDNLQGALTIIGNGSDTLNLDDSGSVSNKSGSMTPTQLLGMGMGDQGVTFGGIRNLNLTFGSGNDSFTLTNMVATTLTTVDGGAGTDNALLVFTGNFDAEELTLLNFETATLTVANDFTGLLNHDGAFNEVYIGGNLTGTGILNAGSVDSMIVGGDLAGLLNVTGLLNSLAVGGGTPGTIVAGDVNLITVLSGYGLRVLRVIEGGVERQFQAWPVDGSTEWNMNLRFMFIYDSLSAADPQLAVLINSQATLQGVGPAVAERYFDLALVVHNANASFDLAFVTSNGGTTGVSNITVDGDILTAISAPALEFLGVLAGTAAGIDLPTQHITGVSVRDTVTIGHIRVGGIQGLSFHKLLNPGGGALDIALGLNVGAAGYRVWLFGTDAVISAPADAFRIAFAEGRNVRLYTNGDNDAGWEPLATFSDQVTDGASITAYVQVSPGSASEHTASLNVRFVGDGGSVQTGAAIGTLTSTGALGDVIAGGQGGIGSITAASIFGSIRANNGAITGIIQTTGIRIDAVTGEETQASGDIGRFLYKKNKISGVTVIYSKGAFSGQVISRGDIISTVQSGGAFTGVIAAQGDIGAIKRDQFGDVVTGKGGSLTRYGGVIAAGGSSGQIVALGNIFGNITVNGSFSGRIAAQGQQVDGLSSSRIGILGKIAIKAFASTAAIISGGMIGDAAGKVSVSCGSPQGFLASKGSMYLAKSLKTYANVLPNAAEGNAAAIEALFTDGGSALAFDAVPGDLQGLALILSDLNALSMDGDGNISGSTP